MPDGRPIERWMSLEMQRLTQALVTQPRPLMDLRHEAAPSAPTRGGGQHRFDKDALDALAAGLQPLTRARLRLPITVYLDHDAPGDCYVAEPAAVEALLELRAAATTPRDGRLWMGVPLARELARQYPTLVQFVYV